MDFLNNISTFGELRAKPAKLSGSISQLTRMRASFAVGAARQATAIRTNKAIKGSNWYITRSDEAGKAEYLVALRNGAKLMPLSGQLTHVRVQSAERAIEFYEQAIAACARGELNELLKSTCRKRRPAAASEAALQEGQPC